MYPTSRGGVHDVGLRATRFLQYNVRVGDACLILAESETEGLVEMTPGPIGDGRIREVHQHGPDVAQIAILIFGMGDGGDGGTETVLVHDAAGFGSG